MYYIEDDFRRSDPEVNKKLKMLPTSTFSDAMGRNGTRTHEIKLLGSGFQTVGSAYTSRYYVQDDLMLHYGLMTAKPGDNLVVYAGDYPEGALWRELMSTMAKRKKLGGIVLDTGVRKSSKTKEVVFFIFSRSVLPMGTLKDAPGSINIPVQCGGDIVTFKDCHLSKKARWMSQQ